MAAAIDLQARPKAMSETKVRAEFVEDPPITTTTAVQHLPPLEGRAREERGHAPPETGSSTHRSSMGRSSVDRCGFNPAGSESADDDDFDLVSATCIIVIRLV